MNDFLTSPAAAVLLTFFLSLAMGWVLGMARKHRLPHVLQDAIDTIGEERIIDAVENAAMMIAKSKPERRAFVVNRLDAELRERNIHVPDGVIGLAVDWVFQREIKRRLP